MSAIPRLPEAHEEFDLGKQQGRVRAWRDLHFKRLTRLSATVRCIEFLKEAGTPRYKRPIWFFWTGPEAVTLPALCRTDLWRFAIEPRFRFLKQHIRLNRNRSSSLVSTQKWRWLGAWAYWQWLLMPDPVQPNCPAWHPPHKHGQRHPLTPAQGPRSALPFLLKSGTPARNTRPAGKGEARPKGYRPAPRLPDEVVFQTQKAHPQPALC